MSTLARSRARLLARRLRPLPPGPGGLTILHFAFEDHRQPGSGGGGFRTHEINRRLARRHRVIAVTCRYPGARRRIEDGVEYRHLGLGSRRLGRFVNIVSYHLLVPLYALFHRADLVVEDFGAPMSSVALPLFCRDPTVAVVQWLFARQTGAKYHLPFHLAEDLGIRVHDRFVVVSEYMGREIEVRHPGASIHVACGGVGTLPEREPVPASVRRHELVFLGRQQLVEKGLDLLLEAFRVVADLDPLVRLVIAGDGPDSARVGALVDSLQLSGRVDRVGHIEGEEKSALLGGAALVVVPSRFESFGLVALEALAAGTPVVGFAIPSLVEIVAPICGVLVAPFDVDGLANTCLALLAQPTLRAAMGGQARERARRFSWDDATAIHEAAYLASAGREPRREPAPRRELVPR